MITSSNINVKTFNGIQSVGQPECNRSYAVPSALSASEAVTSSLISHAQQLRDRLRDVLVSEDEPKAVKCAAQTVFVTPLVGRIESNTSALADLDEVLQDILRRLEI